jgi:hypothetical protein
MGEQLGLFAPRREPVDLRPLAGPHLPYTGGFAGLDAEFRRRSQAIWDRLAARQLEAERAAAVVVTPEPEPAPCVLCRTPTTNRTPWHGHAPMCAACVERIVEANLEVGRRRVPGQEGGAANV